MAEAASHHGDRVATASDHRKLFSKLDNPPQEDSGTDQDELSDDGTGKTNGNVNVEDDPVGVAVSIGRAQTYMRSAQTPAVEKSRILKEQNDYFTTNSLIADAGEKSIPQQARDVDDSAANTIQQTKVADEFPQVHDKRQLPSPWTAHPPRPKRNSIVKTVLSETSGLRRERSSSGSMLAGLKKYLPELPMLSMPKMPFSPTAQNIATKDEGAPKEAVHGTESRGPDALPKRPAPLEKTRSKSTTLLQSPGVDGNIESFLSPISPAGSRTKAHRSNSDNSLYLSRKPTGMSAFDDTSAFAEITEMTNSRFKAITDSLQNSSLRMPKMPAIITNTLRSNNESTSTDDLTRRNAEVNISPSPGTNNSQHSHMQNLRIAKDRQIAEHIQTPQQRAHPILSDALSRTEGDIIVLGGYRGSILRDARPPHRQLWAPVKIGLNLRSVDLEVPLTREEEEREEKRIFSSGTLSHIGPVDICRRLLKHLRKCPNAREGKLRVHDYGYDWRLSPDLLSQRFIAFLESLQCNQSGSGSGSDPKKRGALVIAHSLGGLITRHAINLRPDLFRGVVYAGVPQNCVNILGPLRNGDDVLLSSRVLTAQVNFTMRTSFALLPEDGRCFIQKDTDERFDLDFFNPDTWDEYRLSPCIKSALPAESRTHHQHRKSLIGSISESVSSALPSVPNASKRISWFGSSTPDGDNHDSNISTRDAAKDAVSNAASNAASEALHLTESSDGSGGGITTGESSLEPSMKKAHKSSIATTVTIPPTAAREYLTRTLAEVLAFKQSLAHNPALQNANKYPPNAFIFGKSVPTVYGARVISKDAIKYSDALDDLAFAAGDGVVLASAAQLPEGYKCVKDGRVETDRGHVGLLGDLEGVGRCISAVVEARNRGVGLGCFQESEQKASH